MKNGIILITKHFPFNKGETPAESYLENEINILAANYKKIFVIATEAKQGAEVTCALPENVNCYALQSKASKFVKLGCTLSASFLLAQKKPDEISEEISRKKLNFKSRLFLCYFYKRAMQKLKKTEGLISSGILNLSDYDSVYSFWFFDSAYMALMLKEKYNLSDYKFISRAHRYDLYEENSGINYLPLRPYMLEKLNRVYVCSDNGTEYLSGKYPKYKSKIQTMFLGCKDYGIQPYKRFDKSLHIISCSRLVEVKRVNRIVQTLLLLEKSGIKCEWTHFGGGQLFEELKTGVAKLTSVKVNLKGNVENAEVMRQYSKMSADVFVNVSESEGLPISIMEAVSFGVPVVATDVGGTREIVHNGVNGFLIDKDFTNEQLAEVLLSIANMNDNDYMDLRDNARSIYLEKFEFSRNAEKLISEL